MTKYLSDIEIAQKAKLKPIKEVAKSIGLEDSDLILYGEYKAKIKISTINRIFADKKKDAKLILVSAITPTSAGEGKTTVSIGLAQALKLIGKSVNVALREPSLGPCLGIKGGATGGGFSQVLPMEDINLHFTGDFHSITTANNLISAVLDNSLHFKSNININPRDISWKRVMDMNERALRDIVVGLGGKANSIPRESGFDITAASEIMAILCLSNSYSELKEKISNILLGFTNDSKPVFVKDLKVQGAVTALLKEALLPNLVQTTENGAAFIHGGPFANIAQGANSIMSTKLAMKCANYTITEAGFGFDLGAEKFFDIVCHYGKFKPSAVVIVATIRALKMHGGIAKKDIGEPNSKAVWKGRWNLEKHLESAEKFGMKPIVAINKFVTDTEEEINAVKQICEKNQAEFAVANIWEEGGKGGVELAKIVAEMADSTKCNYRRLYDLDASVEDKIEKIAKEVYGAKGIELHPKAKKNLLIIKKLGYDKLPICIAKTQNSLSDNKDLIRRPTDFTINVREILISAGAGFLVPLTGEIMRMPGLPRVPAAELIDIDDDGNISGLF